MVIAPQGLRGWSRRRYASRRGSPPLLPPAEIPDEQIAAPICRSVTVPSKFFSPPLPNPACRLSSKREPLVFGQELSNPLLPHGGQLLVPAAVEVVAVSPPVGEVGKPRPGDKARLAVEELAVGHPVRCGRSAAATPRILVLVPRPPVEVGGVLLRGKPSTSFLNRGRKPTSSIQPMSSSQLWMRLGHPVQPPRDPRAVLDRHRHRLPGFLQADYSTFVLSAP